MATHRDQGAGEPGAASYPGQTYPSSDYPSSSGWFTAGAEEPEPATEHRYAQRIPRYPADQQPPDAPPTAGTRPQMDEDLRLVGPDIPAAPPEQAALFQPAGPPPEQAATYQPAGPPPTQPVPAAPPMPPSAPQEVQPPPGTGQPVPPTGLADLLHDPTQHTQQVAAYRRPGGEAPRAHNQLAFGLIALAILFDVPVAVILVRSLTATPISASGVVSGLLLLPGLPLLAAGLYHLFTGRIEVRPGDGLAALVRRPMAMLVIGLVLLVAGALAAG